MIRRLFLNVRPSPADDNPPFLRILVAMGLGLGIGAYTSTVFIGVDAIANAFVMLLQMTDRKSVV